MDSDVKSSCSAQFYAKYPGLKRVEEILRAREKGFKDVLDLRHWVRKLTPEELELWADGTKAELEAILARRSK